MHRNPFKSKDERPGVLSSSDSSSSGYNDEKYKNAEDQSDQYHNEISEFLQTKSVQSLCSLNADIITGSVVEHINRYNLKSGWMSRLDAKVTNSRLGDFFQYKSRNASFTKDIHAGIVLFFNIAWTVSVHARSISSTGTVCNGYDIFPNDDYDSFDICQEQAKQKIITGTCLAGFFSTMFLGLWANFPGIMVPGGSMTPYFAFTVVGAAGANNVPYEAAITAVFLEGCLFFIMSVAGVRSLIARLIPRAVQNGFRAGIGLFLVMMAFQGPHGLGIITASDSNLVSLGGCAPKDRELLNDHISGSSWYCDDATFNDPRLWCSLSAIVIVTVFLHYKVEGALVVCMFLLSAIMWIPDTNISEFDTSTEDGLFRWNYFKAIVDFVWVGDHLLVMNFKMNSGLVWSAFWNLFFTDLLDSTATLYSVASNLSLFNHDDNSYLFYGERAAFCSDAIGTILASMVGSSPLTTALESNLATALGGSTGVVSLVAGSGYLLLMFFGPLLSNLPQYAYTIGVLIGGVGNIKAILNINWDDPCEACPAFLVCFLIPMTYSVCGPLVLAVMLSHILWLCIYAIDIVRSKLLKQNVKNRKQFKNVKNETIKTFQQTVWISKDQFKQVMGIKGRI